MDEEHKAYRGTRNFNVYPPGLDIIFLHKPPVGLLANHTTTVAGISEEMPAAVTNTRVHAGNVAADTGLAPPFILEPGTLRKRLTLKSGDSNFARVQREIANKSMVSPLKKLIAYNFITSHALMPPTGDIVECGV